MIIFVSQLQHHSSALITLLKLNQLSPGIQTWIRKQIVDDDPWDDTDLGVYSNQTEFQSEEIESPAATINHQPATNNYCDRSHHLK